MDYTYELDGLKGVPASEILAKIEKGEPIEYDHAIIKGDLDIGKLNLQKDGNKILIKSPIKIINSKIFGSVDFGNTILNETIDFSETEFMINAFFNGIQFNDDACFIGSKFVFGVSFDDTRFNGYARFLKARFNLGSSFKGTQFNTNSWFWQAQFQLNSDFIGAIFKEEANFMEAVFTGKADFEGTKFVESVGFSSALFGSYSHFKDAQFCKKSYFNLAHFCGDSDFSKTQFCSISDFNNAQIEKNAIFTGATFSEAVEFTEAKICGNTNFSEARFTQGVYFIGAQFNGDVLTFRNAEFGIPIFQEDACRRAKIVLEKNGDREEAGYHFYREMDAKRKQKPWYIRYPEFVFIQLIFGYGVHPFRLWACWFIFVGIFAAIYWLGQGIDPIASQLKSNATSVDYIWFSIATAVTPGYAGYKPIDEFKLVAGLEAILGTFMWAAFIATFARKYMR